MFCQQRDRKPNNVQFGELGLNLGFTCIYFSALRAFYMLHDSLFFGVNDFVHLCQGYIGLCEHSSFPSLNLPSRVRYKNEKGDYTFLSLNLIFNLDMLLLCIYSLFRILDAEEVQSSPICSGEPEGPGPVQEDVTGL
jgi:hypothetical protein